MSFELKISGYDDLLRLDDGGEELLKRWKDFIAKKITDEGVEVKNWVGRLSDIRSFRRITGSGEKNKTNEEVHSDYLKKLHEFRGLSVEKKAESLGFFRFMYYGFTRKKSEEVKTSSGVPIEDLARKIQLSFFSKHPKRMYCDPILFRPIIKAQECHEAVTGVIESHIRQDAFSEAHL